MPWECSVCRAQVELDSVSACPACGTPKQSWTMSPERTRNLVLPKREKLAVLRGETHATREAAPLLHLGVAWRETEEGSVLSKAEALALRAGRLLPDSHDVLCVRLEPAKKQKRWQLTVSILFETKKVQELVLEYEQEPEKLGEDGRLDAFLMCVRGPEDVSALRFPHIHVLDVTEETELGHAPELTVLGSAGKKPIHIKLGAKEEPPPAIVRAVLTGLFFELDRTFLLPEGRDGLRALRAYHDAHPALRELLIVGHTDTSGNKAYNLVLSEERALVMAAYLRHEVDVWTRWYQGGPVAKPWGTREDQHMLHELPPGEARFYAEPPDGLPGPKTTQAVRDFQAWSNASRGTTLAVDGVAGPQTRRALVGAYMELDPRLPDETGLDTHGCGEYHPAVPTADGVVLEENRRVEVFLFPAPPGTSPPPPPRCAPAGQEHTSGGCAEHAQWVAQATTVDLLKTGGCLEVRVLDDQGTPVAAAQVELSGPTPAAAPAGPDGVARFADLAPGRYDVVARHASHGEGRTQVDVGGGQVQAASFAPQQPPGPTGGTTTTTVTVTRAALLLVRVEQMFRVFDHARPTVLTDPGVTVSAGQVVFEPAGERRRSLERLRHVPDGVEVRLGSGSNVRTATVQAVGAGALLRKEATVDIAGLPDGDHPLLLTAEPIGARTTQVAGAALVPGAKDALYRDLAFTVTLAAQRVTAISAPTSVHGSAWVQGPLELRVDWKPEWLRAAHAAPRPSPHEGRPEVTVVHATGSTDIAVLRDLLPGGWDMRPTLRTPPQPPVPLENSVHYCVDVDGHVLKMVADDQVANHAAPSFFNPHARPSEDDPPPASFVSVNRFSVGIEVVNDGRVTRYPGPQVAAVSRLIRSLADAFGMLRRNVVGHGEVQTFSRQRRRLESDRGHDPGLHFFWSQLAAAGLAFRGDVAALSDPANVRATMYDGFFTTPGARIQLGDRDEPLTDEQRSRLPAGASFRPLPGRPISELQRDLGQLGYSINDEDGAFASGVYDAATFFAVLRFKTHHLAHPDHPPAHLLRDPLRLEGHLDADTALLIKAVKQEVLREALGF